MDGETLRLIQQMQREIKELKAELSRQRSRAYGALNPSQSIIVKFTSDIDGRAEIEESDDFDVTYATARIWDIAIDDVSATTGTFVMSEVGSRNVVVANPWREDLQGGDFGIVVPYKGIYLPVSEECPPIE